MDDNPQPLIQVLILMPNLGLKSWVLMIRYCYILSMIKEIDMRSSQQWIHFHPFPSIPAFRLSARSSVPWGRGWFQLGIKQDTSRDPPVRYSNEAMENPAFIDCRLRQLSVSKITPKLPNQWFPHWKRPPVHVNSRLFHGSTAFGQFAHQPVFGPGCLVPLLPEAQLALIVLLPEDWMKNHQTARFLFIPLNIDRYR